MTRRLLLSVVVIISVHIYGFSQVQLLPFSTGFLSPVDVRNCGDDRLFVVDQPGRIYIVDTNGVRNTVPFLDISTIVSYGGERGLLGLAFAPDYLTTGYFYVNYTARPQGRTHISRFRVSAADPDQADPASEEILMDIYQPYTNHNGGCIAFSPDNGYLYIGMGDGGSGGDPGNRAQNKDTLLGKMLRIAVTSGAPGYTIPDENPFAIQPTLGRPEIWSVGMRNPWRFSFDRLNGDLYIADVGQGVSEEIDFEPVGQQQYRNYGWRCYEGTYTYNTNGCAPASTFTPPVWEYTHSGGNCSVTGGYVYRGAKYADIFGKYFFTDYCVNQIRTLEKNGSSFTHTNLGVLASGSYTSFGEDKWGELYATDVINGRVMKFSSVACNPVAAINGGDLDSVFTCGQQGVLLRTPAGKNFQYNWTLAGMPYFHNYDTLTVQGDGEVILSVIDPSGCTASDTIYVKSNPLPQISFSGLDSLYCINDSAVVLFPQPLGGVFSGDGITGITFDPLLADSGLHVINYTYSDINGCSNSVNQTTYVDYCLNVTASDLLELVMVYPNPAGESFKVTLPANREQTVYISLFDISGKSVLTESVQIAPGNYTYPVSLDGISSGMYSVRIQYGDQGFRVFKLTVSK